MLNHKVPPPVVMLIVAIVIYFSSSAAWFTSWQLGIPPSYNLIASVLVALIGIVIAVSANISFRRAETTIDPLNPEQASQLVSSGIFKYTRNPMYFGLLLLLLAETLFLNNFSGLIWMAVFVIYINQFQIKPEEKAMENLFKDDFHLYCQTVRRWV